MSTSPHIIVLATAWGPKHGGINAFNVEWVKSLGVTPKRMFDLTCVVLQASDADRADAKSCHVALVELDANGTDMGKNLAANVQTALAQTVKPGDGTCLVWVGHDDKTGPLALALRDGFPDSKAVLFNHMAFGAYQGFKKDDPAQAAEKKAFQRDLFQRADLCFAVGPMLRDHLQDLLSTIHDAPPVKMFVPGLTELDGLGVQELLTAPRNFSAFVAGRLHRDDDRIKQGRLAVASLGKAVADARTDSVLNKSPELRMRGVRDDERPEIQTLFVDHAKRHIVFDLSDYTEDRRAYFTDLASSSLAMMPSWHEGFGLVAWEALACGVPVVIGQQSGVYRLLDERNLNMRHVVGTVNVCGHQPSDAEEAPYTDTDVEATAQAIHHLTTNPQRSKQAALDLRHDLRGRGYVWQEQIKDWLQVVQQQFAYPLERVDSVLPPLEPTRPVSPTGLQWLRLPQPTQGKTPSSLLMAADQVVRFDPQREPDVQHLLKWAQSDRAALSVLRLTGAGGMGKTRLAIELGQRLAASEQQWAVMWLARELPHDWPNQWLDSWAAQQRHGLLVIDYTEGRIEALLRTLTVLQQCPAHAPPLRMLLLCRSGAWWKELRTHPAYSGECGATLDAAEDWGEHALVPWSESDLDVRRNSFKHALENFANAAQQGVPSHFLEPDIGNAAFGRPLYLHLAALAALAGERTTGAQTLLTQQLEREWRYWLHTVRTPYPALAQRPHHSLWQAAMAWLVWTQGSTAAECQAVLAPHNLAETADELQAFVAALVTVYGHPASNAVIEPLQPDLLGEALLQNSLTSPAGLALFRIALHQRTGQCAEVLSRLCARSDGDLRSTPWGEALSHALSTEWPTLDTHGAVQALVVAAHQGEFGLGNLLAHTWVKMTQSAQRQLAEKLVLPRYSVNLLEFWTCVARTNLHQVVTDVQRAAALNTLAICLSRQGDAESRNEALTRVREAVGINRQLTEQQPAAHLSNLASSLNNLANFLSEQRETESNKEAMNCAREVVNIYQQLAELQLATHLPDLMASLNNLANRLFEQGDVRSRQEALTRGREALKIGRQLAEQQSAAYLPDLAGSLTNVATFLYERGDAHSRQEALNCVREAVDIYRQLVEQQRSAYLPELANAINNFATFLNEQGDTQSKQEALTCSYEAVCIRTELAEQQPAAYLPDLAMSLNNFAVFLSAQGDAQSRKVALICAREAATLYQQLAEQHPTAYLPDLAMSLNNLAIRLSEEEGVEPRLEALTCARAALKIYRQLAKQQLVVYLPDLATSLNNLATFLHKQSDSQSRQSAVSCAYEAVNLRRQLVEQQPDAYRPDLAMSLNNLATFLSEQGDARSNQKALLFACESMQIYAELHQQMPATFERNLDMARRVYLSCAKLQGMDETQALKLLQSDE